MDNFVLNKTTLSDEQQNQILISLQSLASTQHIDTGALLSKLGTLFEKTDTNWIEVDFSRWGNNTVDNVTFEPLKYAFLWHQCQSGRTTKC